jgi:hypothetical protein
MRRLYNGIVDFTATVVYLAFEFVIDPILDRGFDFEAYKAAKRAEFYHLHEYD